MPADLRTRLKALVEEWRKLSGSEEGVTRFRWLIAPFGSRHLCTDAGREVGAGLKECADQLAALLAESEPEEVDTRADDDAMGIRCGGVLASGCTCYGDPCPACEAKAKLLLGLMDHAFAPCSNSSCKKCHRNVGGIACGQPLSAHEVK